MKLLFVVNPIAGSRGVAVRLADELLSLLVSSGHSVEKFITETRGDAFARTRCKDIDGYDAVLVLGGDGTLNEVVNGIADRGVPVLPVPVGLSNVLARQMSATRDVKRIAELLERRRTLAIDLIEASFGGRRRYSVGMAGAGFDAEVVSHIARSRSSHLGFSGYVAPVIRTLTVPLQPFRIIADGTEVSRRATYLVVGNVSYYGGPFHITVKASPTDGRMDVLYGNGLSSMGVILFYCSVLLGSHLRHRGVHYLQCRRLDILPLRRDRPAPLHIDGEAVGRIPCSFRVVPQRLRLIVPYGGGE